jgi:hypothetical protein
LGTGSKEPANVPNLEVREYISPLGVFKRVSSLKNNPIICRGRHLVSKFMYSNNGIELRKNTGIFIGLN